MNMRKTNDVAILDRYQNYELGTFGSTMMHENRSESLWASVHHLLALDSEGK